MCMANNSNNAIEDVMRLTQLKARAGEFNRRKQLPLINGGRTKFLLFGVAEHEIVPQNGWDSPE